MSANSSRPFQSPFYSSEEGWFWKQEMNLYNSNSFQQWVMLYRGLVMTGLLIRGNRKRNQSFLQPDLHSFWMVMQTNSGANHRWEGKGFIPTSLMLKELCSSKKALICSCLQISSGNLWNLVCRAWRCHPGAKNDSAHTWHLGHWLDFPLSLAIGGSLWSTASGLC